MSSWILSICGVCILSILIDLFLPSGQMSSHIKSIFNLFIVFVIILPLPSLIKSDFNSSSLFYTEEIKFQTDYIYQLNRDKLTMLEQTIEEKIFEVGLENVDISISADIFTRDMQIEVVFVDLSNLVIRENFVHKDIENEVVDIITSIVKIDKKDIVFSG